MTKFRVTTVLYVFWATACVAASLTVAWWAGTKIGSDVALLSAGGQTLGWILGFLGLSSSALKVLIPWDNARTCFKQNPGLPALSLWTSSFLYSWGAAVFAGLQLHEVAALPTNVLLFLGGAWGLIEVGAAWLPAVSRRAFRQPCEFAPISGEAQLAATQISPAYRCDLAEFVHRIFRDGKAPSHLGIALGPDGTILTSQSALAKALGQSKATVHRRLHALYASGAITLATNGSRTRIGLGRRATSLAA